jgi:hypothetical protein
VAGVGIVSDQRNDHTHWLLTSSSLTGETRSPRKGPFAIALFFARHLVSVAFARIFAVAVARWQQQGNEDNGGGSDGGGGKYNNQLKRGQRNSDGDRNGSGDIQQ